MLLGRVIGSILSGNAVNELTVGIYFHLIGRGSHADDVQVDGAGQYTAVLMVGMISGKLASARNGKNDDIIITELGEIFIQQRNVSFSLRLDHAFINIKIKQKGVIFTAFKIINKRSDFHIVFNPPQIYYITLSWVFEKVADML